jgi:hypothetical protein
MAEDVKDPHVIKFEPPAHVRLVDPEDRVIDRPIMRWDQLAPGARAAIPNPWRDGQFLLGDVQGVPGQMVFVVGSTFGQLEHVEELGWVCNGLVQQSQVWNAVGAAAAEEAKGSFTERLTRKAARAKSGSSTK